MRDPSLVASKADIGQQAIKGGEAPQADIRSIATGRRAVILPRHEKIVKPLAP